MGWAAVGVTAWAAVSVPVALLAGAAMRPRGRGAVRVPSHVRHGLGCRGGRMVAGRV
jgi:hypothetical protein